ADHRQAAPHAGRAVPRVTGVTPSPGPLIEEDPRVPPAQGAFVDLPYAGARELVHHEAPVGLPPAGDPVGQAPPQRLLVAAVPLPRDDERDRPLLPPRVLDPDDGRLPHLRV